MATLSENINQAINDFNNIKIAIENKGVEVPEGTPTSEYDNLIENISIDNIEFIKMIERAGVSVEIPQGTTKIGNYAFYTYLQLTSITIPNSITSIGNYAFYHCSGLTSLTIPNSVTSIGNHAFYGCIGLTGIIIPSSITIISNSMFQGCTGLTSIIIPNNITMIRSHAFGSCTGLTSLTISEGVTYIGDYAFQNCLKLTSLTIPSSVTGIGIGPFVECSKLENISVDSNNADYCSDDGNLYNKAKTSIIQYCAGKIEISFEIPNTVTSIMADAFWDSKNLTDIIIPNSVTNIGNYAFYGCTGLTDIIIPSSVVSMGTHVFYNCNSLQNIIIPNSVTSMGTNTFGQCLTLRSVTIGSGIINITGGNFYLCQNLQSVTILGVITGNVGTNAFYGCRNLSELILASGFNANNLNLSASTLYTTNMIVSWFNALADRTGQIAYTLTIGTENLAKLTAEQIAIATNKNWNLAHIYKTNDEFENDLKSAKKYLKILEKYKGKLTQADVILDFFEKDTEFSIILEKLSVYAFCKKDDNGKDNVNVKNYNIINDFYI